jgi:DNA-binding NarL/FixJ family response regulator
VSFEVRKTIGRRDAAIVPSSGIVIWKSDKTSSISALASTSTRSTAGLAYLLKDRVGELEELLRALREVTTGGSVIDPKVVEGLLARRQQLAGSLLETLTSRESEVLSEMAQGKSNAAIKDSLYISPSAVEKHINSIFAKLMLSAEDGAHHRRVAAVLTFLRNQELRGSPEARE